jgi:hypothetical protein
MFSRNCIIIACLIAVSASAQNRIWSNGAYGKVDPREYLPESLYTNCVAWYCMNQNPAQFATWRVLDGIYYYNYGQQTNANSRPILIGTALSFDGVDDYFVSTNATPSSAFAVFFWVKELSPSATAHIVSRRDVSGGGPNRPWTVLGTSAKYYFQTQTDDPGNATVSSIGGLRASNTWISICGTYNGSIQVLYVSGVPVSTNEQSGSLESTTVPITIGCQPGSANPYSSFFNGLIDGLVIFNRDVSASEVSVLHNSSKSSHP